jgi:hypothetical protein
MNTDRYVVQPGFESMHVTFGQDWTTKTQQGDITWTNISYQSKSCYFYLPAVPVCSYGIWPQNQYSISTQDDTAKVLRSRLNALLGRFTPPIIEGHPDYVNIQISPGRSDKELLKIIFIDVDGQKKDCGLEDLRNMKGKTYDMWMRAAVLQTDKGHVLKFYLAQVKA